jgi:hypothetical protein
LILLLVIPLGLLWLVISAHRERLGFGNLSIRGALLLAFLVFEVLVLGITELTSLGHHFTAGAVAGAWSIVVIALLVMARAQIILLIQRLRGKQVGQSGLVNHAKRLTGEERFWVAVMAAIFGVLVAEGFLYPPSSGDVLVYHLARVEHWIQDRTVAPFAAHYLPQVDLSPLAEYNLAHLHLLSGGDRFDSCVQLFAALICIVGVSEIARLLGASRSIQIAASVICATIPSGILLASTAGNDYFTASTGVVLLVILLTFSFNGRWEYRALALGAALGVTYMAKSNMAFLVGPAVVAFVAVAAYRQVRTDERWAMSRRMVAQFAVIITTALAIVGAFVVQTAQVFGSLVGPTASGLTIGPFSIAGFGSNIVRSVAANFDIGDGVSGLDTYVSMLMLGGLKRVYSVFGVSINDPSFTITKHQHTFATANYSLYQRIGEFGANPWNVLLSVLALVILVVCVARGRREFRLALLLTLSLGCGFVFFTGIAKWSPFAVRYQLPLLVAASVVIAIALSIFHRWVMRLVLVGLVVACLPQLLSNAAERIVPPYSYHGSYLTAYFGPYGNPPGAEEASAYQTVTTMLAQSTCTKAVMGNWVYLEYPLWVGLQHQHYKGVLNDINVHNATRRFVPTYKPCASITQQGSRHITPSNGLVNVQQSNLALSISPRDAETIRIEPPGFHSTIRGTRVLPGGGWSMDSYGTLPFLYDSGSMYLFSTSAQTIQLQLDLVSTVPQSTLSLSTDGHSIPTTVRNHTIDADVHLHRGVTRVDTIASPNAKAHERRLIMTEVRVSPAPASG